MFPVICLVELTSYFTDQGLFWLKRLIFVLKAEAWFLKINFLHKVSMQKHFEDNNIISYESKITQICCKFVWCHKKLFISSLGGYIFFLSLSFDLKMSSSQQESIIQSRAIALFIW